MWRLNLSWPSSNRQRWSLGMGRLRPRGRSQQEHRWILLYFAGTLCYSRRLVLNCWVSGRDINWRILVLFLWKVPW
ncbi:hypothetical protein V6Z12_A11G043700 [Gossypium hirsutum]